MGETSDTLARQMLKRKGNNLQAHLVMLSQSLPQPCGRFHHLHHVWWCSNRSLTSADRAREHELRALVVGPERLLLHQDAPLVVDQGTPGRN